MKMKVGFGFPCSYLRWTYRIFRRALKLKGEAEYLTDGWYWDNLHKWLTVLNYRKVKIWHKTKQARWLTHVKYFIYWLTPCRKECQSEEMDEPASTYLTEMHMCKRELTCVTGHISSAPSTSPTTSLTEELRKTSWSTGLSMDLIYGIAAIKIIFFWSNCMASWTSRIDTVYKTVTYIKNYYMCSHLQHHSV